MNSIHYHKSFCCSLPSSIFILPITRVLWDTKVFVRGPSSFFFILLSNILSPTQRTAWITELLATHTKLLNQLMYTPPSLPEIIYIYMWMFTFTNFPLEDEAVSLELPYIYIRSRTCYTTPEFTLLGVIYSLTCCCVCVYYVYYCVYTFYSNFTQKYF